ncbi:hypothetical protein VTJ49DRAFT_651 [Mycothermus thermophilus]|uniref:Uncharacterized protein n=1 Tax=Humicola insolens TaxID=85995 RepID=A0ABR3VG53_HUMIN
MGNHVSVPSFDKLFDTGRMSRDDHGLYNKFIDKQQLDAGFFYSTVKNGFKKPDHIPELIAEAALGAGGAIALVIPVVGPALFAFGTLSSFVYRADLLLESPPKQADNRLTLMKTDIIESMKATKLNQYTAKLDTLLQIIKVRAGQHEDIFRRVSSADYLVVKNVHDILNESAFGARSDQALLLVMLETLMKEYRWASTDVEQAIIHLVPFLIQCMELRLILSANLAAICEDSDDRQEYADRYVVEFQTDLDFVAQTLTNTIKKLRDMIADQRKRRRNQFSGKINCPTNPYYPFVWTFHDDFSGRTFSYTLHEPRRRHAGFGFQGMLADNDDDFDVDEARDKIEGLIKQLANWYGEQLQAHCDRHFAVLERVIERWENAATALHNWWKTEPGKPGHPLDGPTMYLQMASRVAVAQQP